MKILYSGASPALLWVCAMILSIASPFQASAHQDDPEDPFARVSETQYRSIIRGHTSSQIVEKPDSWRELNDRAEKIGGPRGQLRGLNDPIRKRKKRKR